MVTCKDKGVGWVKGEVQEGFKDIANLFFKVSGGQLFYYSFKLDML